MVDMKKVEDSLAVMGVLFDEYLASLSEAEKLPTIEQRRLATEKAKKLIREKFDLLKEYAVS